MNTAVDMPPTDPAALRQTLAGWLWRPWYAKTWWALIPVWWIGMALSTKVAPLEALYDSALAGFLNILFFPMTALMVLGVGFVRNWLDQFAGSGSDEDVMETHFGRSDPFGDEFNRRRFGQPPPFLDIYDPRSGTLYVGNPLSPNNGARINVP